MESDRINEIIGLVLAGEANEEEGRTFEEWLGQSEANRLHFKYIKNEWGLNRKAYKVVNEAEIKERIWNAGMENYRKETPRKRFHFALYARVAAVLVIFITASLLILKYNPAPNETVYTPQWAVKMNPAGQKSKVFLPDGSEVWLNAGSQLRYLENFSQNSRTVHLEGEAYFTIARDTARPFIVIAENISVTALGTTFNVNAFQHEVEVALVSGKVKLEDISDAVERPLILEPGQFASFNYDDGQFITHKFNPDEVTGWKDGVLYFKDASFNEIIKKLERWYGVRIRADGGAIRKHYTGRFTNENLRNVLESISFALDFNYKLKDKNVTLYVR